MRTIKLLSGVIFLVAFSLSCEKRETTSSFLVQTSDYGAVASLMSTGSGGNSICGEGYISVKADYVNGKFVFESGQTEWPYGLVVETDGESVSFHFEGNSVYCVGAVIVKGGPSSNRYEYNPGVKIDGGLVAPLNSSGKPAGLSNLTFCFVECPPPDPEIIAIKLFFSNMSESTWAASSGVYIFAGNSWCAYLGINELPTTTTLNLNVMQAYSKTIDIGDITVSNDGTVTVTLDNGLTIDVTYVYIGTEADLLSQGYCPIYKSKTNGWTTYDAPNNSNVQTFKAF